jgi:DNA topoisomerase VI subunit A
MLAIVDPDPYGIDIFLVYRFGSCTGRLLHEEIGTMADLTEILPLQYLGVRPSQLQAELAVDKHVQVWLPLTPRDKTRAASIPIRYPLLEDYIKSEASLLLSGGLKAEIEALSALDDHGPPGSDFLVDTFIPRELQSRGLLTG